ncbi:MAG: MarC family protein [Thermodesulfobacteriota bacterium]
MVEQILKDFIMIFVTIDPIGTLSLFVPLTSGVDSKKRFEVAKRAVLFAGIILFAFLIVGQIVLSMIGVKLVSFQLAGGIILFLFSLQMVFGTVISQSDTKPEPDHDLAVFPLAIPSIASPGSIMAVVLLTDNHSHSYSEQGITMAVLLVVLLITLVILKLANPIHRIIGNSGSNIMIRVMGLILAALATQQIIEGIVNIINNKI